MTEVSLTSSPPISHSDTCWLSNSAAVAVPSYSAVCCIGACSIWGPSSQQIWIIYSKRPDLITTEGTIMTSFLFEVRLNNKHPRFLYAPLCVNFAQSFCCPQFEGKAKGEARTPYMGGREGGRQGGLNTNTYQQTFNAQLCLYVPHALTFRNPLQQRNLWDSLDSRNKLRLFP
jgi:hypothetical protein